MGHFARRGLILAVFAVAALCSVSIALAASGDPDPSFDGDGKVILGLGTDNPGVGVAVQSDGKILVAGGGSGNSLRVSRLNTDGSIDTSFGTNGSSDFDFGQPTKTNGMTIAPDGKIVLVGTTKFPSGTDPALARANPDGTPDTSFGPNGTRDADTGTQTDDGVAVAEQPDGKVVFAATTANGVITVGRLNATGHFDGTFKGGGVDNTPVTASATAIALQPDGKILVGGLGTPAAPTNANNQDMVVTRLTAAGDQDPSFNKSSVQVVDAGGNESVADIAVQPDGKIVLAGRGSTTSFGVARLNTDGTRDSGFGTNGFTTFAFGNPPTLAGANGVVLQPDGKIVLAGGGQGAAAVARLQPGGALDTTFSGDGEQTLDFDPQNLDFGNAVAVAPGGDIVIAGSSAGNTVVGRLQGDPAGSNGGGGGDGGAGSVPRCEGKAATIVGTTGRDNLKGTRKSDVIVALGGNDKISGGRGNDVICGGGGNDRISGGAGTDKISGGNGNDSESGGAGKDILSGGGGKDKLSGGAGNDKLSGGAGNDTLGGGAGKDKLSGGGGKDKDSGGSGSDTCSGSDKKSSC
ncbi:MAG TPA: hypothetical protein VGI67_00435 [Thermoleophilaceae bacterium]